VEAAAQEIAKTAVEKDSTGEWSRKWATDRDADVYVSVGIVGSNLVTVSVSLEVAGHGAAHSSEDSFELNWLMKQKREMLPKDVFRPNSSWQDFIEARCSKGLEQDLDSLYSDWKDTLPKVVLNPRNWTIDNKGIAVNFPEYSVSPRVYPVGPITISWTALKPYLQRSFIVPK